MRAPKMQARGDVAINMTPMIDVVFLLIIFFLVSSHLAKQEVNVKLDLPTAATSVEEQQDKPQATINVLADGTWQIGGQWTTRERLQNTLMQRWNQEGGNLRVRIRTDRTVPYQQVNAILKICAEVGIGDIVFSVFEERRKASQS